MKKRIATTIWTNEPSFDETFLIDRRGVSVLQHVLNVFKARHSFDIIILNGALGARDKYVDLLAAMVLKLSLNRPFIIIADCTWEAGSRALAVRFPKLVRVIPKLARLMIRLLNHPKVLYCVLSNFEKENFSKTWNVQKKQVYFTPFGTTLFSREFTSIESNDYIFAGGNSLRNYDLLAQAYENIAFPLKIASSYIFKKVNPYVVCQLVSQDVFFDQMARSKIVITPLQNTNRSAGQQTYLNAMALGKLVIVTDAPGVRDHIRHGETGIVVENSVESLRSAIEWAIDPKNEMEVKRISEAGQLEVLSHWTHRHYFRSLMNVAKSCQN